MVECELSRGVGDYDTAIVLIDTWWNVNFIKMALFIILQMVLIDTWWNVNKSSIFLLPSFYRVLIDTWWNVNYHKTHPFLSPSSFNRYMVECESSSLIYNF